MAEGLEIERELANRRVMVFGLAIAAWAAAGRGDAERAGMLWGAIEAENGPGSERVVGE